MSSENFAMLKMVRYNATSFTLIIHAWDVTGGDKTWIMVKHIYINVFNFSNLFKVKVAFSQKKKGLRLHVDKYIAHPQKMDFFFLNNKKRKC